MSDPVEWIWMDGEWVRWENATVHVLSHSLHYGFAAFEGIRCYPQTAGGSAVFRLSEHIQRLYDSAHCCGIEVRRDQQEVFEACREVVSRNNLTDGCYIRPLIYLGTGNMGLAATDNPSHVSIAAWKWGAYLGDEGIRSGIRCKVSSYRRARGDVILSKAKVAGQYVTSILAKREALQAGYQEALMLDSQGFVSEGSGENLFVVRQGRVTTPFVGEAILAGITRDSVLTLLKDEGIEVDHGPCTRDQLYCADEVFLTGTAAEITPVREVDDRRVGPGQPGEITRMLQDKYSRATRGELERYRGWVTPV